MCRTLFAPFSSPSFGLLCALVLVTLGVSRAHAVTTTINPIKDATVYSENITYSNGSGTTMQIGQAGSPNKNRRTLLQFDLSGIPAGSTINNVTLTMHTVNVGSNPQTVTVHRLTQDWSEGPSLGAGSGGGAGVGSVALATDVTWHYRSYPSLIWTTAGGSHIATSSAGTAVSANATDYTWSGAGLIADVQNWHNGTNSNYGWILKGNESAVSTAKNFTSRQGSVVDRPRLVITYSPPGNTGRCCFPNGTCQVITAAACAAANPAGVYFGNGSDCSNNPCVQPTGACCFGNGTCQNLSAAACATQSGVYQGNATNCGSTTCPVLTGACCLPNSSCTVVSQFNCAGLNGTYQGNNTTCSGVSCLWALQPFVDPLPIPQVALPTSGSPGDFAHYDMYIEEFSHQFHSGLPYSTVWGYQYQYPGPTFEARKYKAITVNWFNNLRTGHFQNYRTTHFLPVDTCLHGPNLLGHGSIPYTVTHLHGAHLKPDSDGDPDAGFPPGQGSPTYLYPNVQEAATMWYHDHAVGLTRLNVYMGLAGFYLLRDDDEDALGLPSGEFEVPLVIQDRSFDVNGQLKYTNGFTDHFFGEFVCVNGKVWPYMDVKRAKYRFRIVNGSSNRTYTLTMPRLLMFNNLYLNVTQQIGTDLGLLPAPVPITSLTIMPGERADIIVDFTSFAPNSTFTITNSALSPFPSGGIGPDVQNVMRFNVGSEQVFSSAIPSSLVAVPPIPTNTASNSRSFQLAKTFETECNHDVWLINSLGWDDLTDFPYLNSTEIWSFINRSGISHPMHVHLVHFQVLDRQAFTVGAGDVIIPTGPVILPLPQERGWKDTVQATPNQITRVIMKFENFPGKFPFHCHILDHEDHEMMRLFQAICRPIRTGGEPTDLVFLPGETVTLNAEMDGDMLEYQWFNEMSPVILQDGDTSDGSIVYGVTTSQLTFLNFQPGLQGLFRARAVDPCGHSEVSLPARVLFHLCIADVDDSTGTGVPDGGVGIEDLLYYLQVYDAGTSRGDVDDGAGTGQRDGGVGIEDLLFYLERYDAGC